MIMTSPIHPPTRTLRNIFLAMAICGVLSEKEEEAGLGGDNVGGVSWVWEEEEEDMAGGRAGTWSGKDQEHPCFI